MPTATQAEQATQTETVTFIAKSPNQVLTRRPARHVDNGLGGKEVLSESEWMERMRERGEDFDDTPWKVEFINHSFSTDDARLIEWLRNHRNFNANVPGGFYEQGAAPDEPQPTMDQQMKQIKAASGKADIDGLKAVLDLERETHNRPVIVQAAEAALLAFAGGSPEPGAAAGTGDGTQSGSGGSNSTS